jgi:hypothetical protein
VIDWCRHMLDPGRIVRRVDCPPSVIPAPEVCSSRLRLCPSCDHQEWEGAFTLWRARWLVDQVKRLRSGTTAVPDMPKCFNQRLCWGSALPRVETRSDGTAAEVVSLGVCVGEEAHTLLGYGMRLCTQRAERLLETVILVSLRGRV